MSVIVDFSLFPMDKGVDMSSHVASALRIIRASGLPHVLGPMGTSIEGELPEVMAVVQACLEEMKKNSERVYATLKIDYRSGPSGRLGRKVQAVEDRL